MELYIEQTLQQGIAAHKEGKIHDAKRFYRAILDCQPTHADANHNLGLLTSSANKVDVALLMFKIALEADPKMNGSGLVILTRSLKKNSSIMQVTCLSGLRAKS